MGRIQSTVGLVSGVPIQDTVEQLLAVSARPRDLLNSRNARLQAEQTAVTDLTARTIGVQLSLSSLKQPTTFDATTATSSNESLLSVATQGQPNKGSFQFTPVQQAQSHQSLSSGFSTRDEPIGAGQLHLGTGGFVDRTTDLTQLNSGQGVQRGKIKITDRSGSSATIDLRFARTVDDVLQAINTADDIEVTATTDGDSFKLLDTSGASTSNLRVQEVSGGSTAADLGLGSVDEAADYATGTDTVSLHDNLELSQLNDRNGVRTHGALSDLEIYLQDGSVLFANFQSLAKSEGFAKATTVAAGGNDSQVVITAKNKGSGYDNVTIRFENDDAVTRGNETVEYDGSDVENRTLTFKIDAGATTADDIVAALAADPQASELFSAANHSAGDGSGLIDLADIGLTIGGAAKEAKTERTLGEVIETLNTIDPARLQAKISDDGERLELVDLTSGSEEFKVASAFGSGTAEDLGLTGDSVGGTLSSRRLQSGLQGPLLSSLGGGQAGGGQGLGELGQLDITDRSGATATIDLSGSETLDEVLAAINNAGLGVEARVNSIRNGIELVDTTGASASNLIVANADPTNSAERLGIAVDDSVTTVNSGSLRQQVVSHQTKLEELNSGQGIAKGQFLITDTKGKTSVIDLRSSSITTLGDAIKEINDASVGVEARINDTGDGLVVIDTAGGEAELKIAEVGGTRTAADLKIKGTGEVIDVGGELKQVIDGRTTSTIEITETDTLDDLVAKINALGAGVSASVFSDGSGIKPYHISLVSETSGQAGELLLDTSDANFSFDTLVEAQDALLLFGSSDSSAGVLSSSSTNRFNDLVEGVSLTVQGTSTETVKIDVKQTDTKSADALQQFVNQYNNLRAKLDENTFFDEASGKKGILFGSNVALRIDTDFSRLITDRFFGVGSLQSLEEVGISAKEDGTLSFNRQKYSDQFAADSEAVKRFFSDENLGVAKKLDSLVESIAGRDNSLLVNRSGTLQNKIDTNSDRIASHNIRLSRERERLLTSFYGLEEAIAKLQANQTALQSIQPVAPL